MHKRLLVVDDEPVLLKGLKYSLEQEDYEIDTAVDGEEAYNKAQNEKYDMIILDLMSPKMNGLEEPGIIQALYRASQAGVKIDLVVRGICCLRPGVEGISDNIRVRSVLGRFLEHSRLFYFHNGGEPEVFCASADWMGRNLLRRVETCFPIRDDALRREVVAQGLSPYFSDNVGTWQLQSDGAYRRIKARGAEKNAQITLMKKLGTLLD